MFSSPLFEVILLVLWAIVLFQSIFIILGNLEGYFQYFYDEKQFFTLKSRKTRLKRLLSLKSRKTRLKPAFFV